MKNEYRINLRMNPNKAKHREIIDFFTGRKTDESFSRSEFIADAILDKIHEESKNDLLEEFREIIRDELGNISVIVSDKNDKNVTADIPEFDEEQVEQSEADVLDILKMF